MTARTLPRWSRSCGAGEVKGYNIYRDGQLIGNVEANVRSFIDKQILQDADKHLYGVTAVYAAEESEATLTHTVTGINGLTLSGSAFDVYSPDGIRVAKGVKNLKSLKKGVYIVNGQKVVVK